MDEVDISQHLSSLWRISRMTGGLYNWITSANMGKFRHCPATPCYLTSVQSTSQASRAAEQVPPLSCKSAEHLGPKHFSAVYVLWDPDITKDDRLHLPRCVCCILPAPFCSNPSYFPPETINNTQDANGTLLLNRAEASMCAVTSVLEKQGAEWNRRGMKTAPIEDTSNPLMAFGCCKARALIWVLGHYKVSRHAN
jgi:hypothetical protein